MSDSRPPTAEPRRTAVHEPTDRGGNPDPLRELAEEIAERVRSYDYLAADHDLEDDAAADLIHSALLSVREEERGRIADALEYNGLPGSMNTELGRYTLQIAAVGVRRGDHWGIANLNDGGKWLKPEIAEFSQKHAITEVHEELAATTVKLEKAEDALLSVREEERERCAALAEWKFYESFSTDSASGLRPVYRWQDGPEIAKAILAKEPPHDR